MDLSKTAPPAPEDTPAGEFPPKRNLVGQIIVFSPHKYTPEAETRFGVQPQIDAEIILVTGPEAPCRDAEWREWGNLARNMSRIPIGAVGVARVASGASANGQWYGLDYDLPDDDRNQALAVAQAVLSGLTAQPAPAAAAPAQQPAAPSSEFPF